MRLKKGDKVEVMKNIEAPVSWWVGEILSGNGHTYKVQYDSYPGIANETIVETVSRKFVRPCPPLVQGVENWISGDIMEVFYEYEWKIAAILRVVEGNVEIKRKKIRLHSAMVGNQYLVRVLGCSQELIVDESNIRTRQTWHDDKWILIGKSSRGGEDLVASNPSTSACHQKMNFRIPQFNDRSEKQPHNNCMNSHDESSLWDSPMVFSRSLKRMSPYSSSIIEAHNGHSKKVRPIDEDCRKQRVFATPVLEKVDAVSYPREIFGGKNMHASFKTISNGYNDSDSDACSVGSCTATDQCPNNFCIPFAPQPCQEADVCSDAESYYGSGSERKSSSLPPKDEVEISIHRLELHAYRKTLEALYASGSLSWEQEAMLTNLRIMLHISNDEHLMELKDLISVKTARNVR